MLQQQPRIVVVTRETRLEGLLQRWATKGQARFVFQRAKAAAAVQAGNLTEAAAAQTSDSEVFDELEQEDETYGTSVRELTRDLDFGLPVQVIDRRYLPTYDFGLCSAVVVVGQDGLVANTAKYVGGVPIVGVNPDPARFDGVLLPFEVPDARRAVSRVLNDQALVREVTLAQATLQDGQKMLAFNDLFVGARSHVSARYELRTAAESETQSSSGVLICTGAGSTGWMSSVFNMTRGVARCFGGNPPTDLAPTMNWGDAFLLWTVREPFISRTSGADLVAGRIDARHELVIESRMSSGGVIFSDGVEADFLDFNGGSIARIGVADQRARLVVPR